MTTPAPLTPPDCDLRAFRTFPFDIGRFRDSELVSHEEPEAILAAILLWGIAWHQVPAASLPDDDKLLARYAGYGRMVSEWKAIRKGALRGFVKCTDGRLYHRVLAEKANESWDQKLRYEHSKAADRHRKAQRDLPDEQRFDFPAFDDWKAGRTVPTKPSRTQHTLDLGEPDFSTAPSARAHAHGTHGTRTERARTGAKTVPSDNSSGTTDTFQRNAPGIPVENALKGEERRGEESSSRDSSQPTSLVTRGGRLGNADLIELYEAVCEASGFTTSSPAAIDRNLATVERWKHQGFDFDTVVIPTIRNSIANDPEPTRTLSRFTKAISHEHARQKAKAINGTVYTSLASPILKPSGEDPAFQPIRLALLESLGAKTYALVANDIRFEDIGETAGGHPLRVKGPDHLKEAWTSGSYKSYLKRAAQPLGFTDVWK